ncbi:MAG: plastocyanin/azurin family copper-binding protein [Elsteraceae bacterium]
MNGRLKASWLAITLLGCFLAGGAAAAVQQASQKGRAFLPREVSLAVGDQLTIANDDEFTHQVYIQSDGFNFDSGEQDPGKAATITFTRAGAFDVLCRIHPKMKLRVTVK